MGTFKSYSDMFPATVHESRFGGGGWSVVIFFLEILGLLLKGYLCYYFFRNGYCPCCPRSDTPPGAEDHHDPPAGEYVEKEIDMSQYNTSPNVDDIRKCTVVPHSEPNLSRTIPARLRPVY